LVTDFLIKATIFTTDIGTEVQLKISGINFSSHISKILKSILKTTEF
jgi:hypothetical protein